MNVQPVTSEFAAEVSGIDLAQPIDTATVRAIWDAIEAQLKTGSALSFTETEPKLYKGSKASEKQRGICPSLPHRTS